MSEEQTPDINSAGARHWMYGLNTAVLAVVALLVAIILLSCAYLVDKATHFELRAGGSPMAQGSRMKLAEIDQKGEKFTIVSLFTDPPEELKRNNPKAAGAFEHHRRQVNDLLNLYKRFSTHIAVEDRGDASMDELERMVRDRYKEDFKPYQEAMDAYAPLIRKLSDFLTQEGAAIAANAQKAGTPEDEKSQAAMIQAQFSAWLDETQSEEKILSRMKGKVLPDWAAMTQQAGERIDQIEPLLGVLGDANKLKDAPMPKSLQTYFTANADGYKAMDKQLQDFEDKVHKLQPLKAQEVISNLDRDMVLVLGEKSAKVITENELYPDFDPNSGSGAETFAGEELITDQLYSMAYPDRHVKVVFVTPTPQHLLDDTFSLIKTRLERKNFDVLEWSPTADQPQQGMPAQPAGPPPAQGAGVVWIVFTPDQPPMMMGSPPPDATPVLMATKQHMDRGGAVLFLADAGGGLMGPSSFPYADLVKDFGIDVESKYTVVHQIVQTDQNGQSTTDVLKFLGTVTGDDPPLELVKHDITGPAQGLPLIMGPMQTNGPMGAQSAGDATVVKVLQPLPTGVSAQEIIKTPYSPDYWGSAQAMGTPKFNKDTDLKSPLPLAAVAIKGQGTKDERRVVVMGSKYMASNFFLNIKRNVLMGDTMYQEMRFRGNMVLFRNMIEWLAGQQVTPDSTTVAYVDFTPGTQLLLKLLLALVLPVAILATGAVILLRRRR